MIESMRVLLVEDEPVLASRIAEGLRDQGMAVDIALDGRVALEKADAETYDVVVLDRDLPVVHGDRVCAELVARADAPRILMLTAMADLRDRVAGLELGADDYLGKPFAFAELVARIRALARRPPSIIQSALAHGDLVLDGSRRIVTRGGLPVSLRPKEFSLLEALLRADGRVLAPEELLRGVWDENADSFSNTVAVTIGRLRRRLGEPPLIITVPGVGYRI